MEPEDKVRELEEAAEWLEDVDFMDAMDSIIPTACPEGCEVEPDGTCPHGYRSYLLVCGLI